MRAEVTNRSAGVRSLHLEDGGSHPLDPGETAVLALAEHPVHRAWEASGDITVRRTAEVGGEPLRRRMPRTLRS